MDRWELTETQRNWLADVEACAAGGSSMKAYAEEHGFDLQSFYLWKGRLKKLGFVAGRQGGAPTHSAQLVSIPLPASRQTSARTRIELPSGISIEASRTMGAAMLRDRHR